MPIILIGLTGGIACGKSTVCSMLSEDHHIPIIDADLIVRELQAPGTPCTRRIAQRWPDCVDAQTGALKREALGQLIFNDPAARKALGSIMNGPIFSTILTRILGFWWRGLFDMKTSVVVLDAPTLFETKLFTFLVSSSVVVACSEERQMERLASRNGMDRAAAKSRIRSQMPLEKKRKLAGYVIENDAANDVAELRKTVEAAVEWMERQSPHKLTAVVSAALAVCVGVVAIVAKCVQHWLF